MVCAPKDWTTSAPLHEIPPQLFGAVADNPYNSAAYCRPYPEARMAWWMKMFQVEMKCTHKQGQRSAECAARGWHVVDSHEAERDARADAEDMTRRMGVPYRATNRLTGLPL